MNGLERKSAANAAPRLDLAGGDPLAIDGIDIKSALKRTGGNRQRYESLLRQIRGSSGHDRRGHSQGAVDRRCGNGGACRPFPEGRRRHARRHRTVRGRGQDRTAIRMGQGIDAALSSLLIDLGAAVGAIRAALPQEAPTNGGGGSSRDPRTVVEPLTRLKRLLETDDGEAADFMIDARSQLAWVLTTTEITSLEIQPQ